MDYFIQKGMSLDEEDDEYRTPLDLVAWPCVLDYFGVESIV